MLICLSMAAQADQPQVPNGGHAIVLSSITGKASRSQMVQVDNPLDKPVLISVSFEGEHAAYFRCEPASVRLQAGGAAMVRVSFRPAKGFVGLVASQQVFRTESDEVLYRYPVRALSSKALEGKNEPPLFDVVRTLGYGIDLGWETLGHHVRPGPIGEELTQTLFGKAGDGPVRITPVARYSPRFRVPFGYYVHGEDGTQPPVLFEVGVLKATKKSEYPEHQTLFPMMEKRAESFDPGDQAFGFFTTSPSHTAYSQDTVNERHATKSVAHACRIYPVKDLEGVIMKDQYLVCFEEATNGDYQDYVFLVENLRPVAEQ